VTDFALGQSSPAEIAARLEAERSGRPHLVLRDAGRVQIIFTLGVGPERLTIGRGEGAEVQIHWDKDASRAHAELERIGGVWTLSDDGLSRNGTFVNDRPVEGRRRLMDGDLVRCGDTLLLFVSPFQAADQTRARRTLQ
jgi:pSer/pThr/pTyr-binding forkhead associated (FHA) protein